jgi:hypothetical protein
LLLIYIYPVDNISPDHGSLFTRIKAYLDSNTDGNIYEYHHTNSSIKNVQIPWTQGSKALRLDGILFSTRKHSIVSRILARLYRRVSKCKKMLGHQVTLFYLILVFFFANALADHNKTFYSYQYDSDGYVNHQISNHVSMNAYGLEYNHNETTSQAAFYYDTLLATKTGTIYDIDYKVGVGSLSGLNWSPTPIYYIDLFKGGFNLNVSRDARASGSTSVANLVGDVYSKTYSDGITLTYEFDPLPDVSLVFGGRQTMFEDGVDAQGLLFKSIYRINEDLSIQYHNAFSFSNVDTTRYFNRRQTSYNRILLSYTKPLLNESLVIRVLIGPSLTEINRRREIVPHHEEKIIYRLADSVRLEANHLCIYSTYEYYYCQLGGNIDVTF